MKKPLQLFLTFFKIGAFTLGGGYAMLSMVEKAVVDQKKWIPTDEFWDMIAVIQSLPGVFAVNTALYVGHRVAGTKGAFAAMLGAIIPSIAIILLLATVFREYRDQPVVERIFKGIRPCVVALILAPSLRMIKSAKVTWKTAIIPIAAVLLIWWGKCPPAYIILIVIAGSLMYALNVQRFGTKGRETEDEGLETEDEGLETEDGGRKTEDGGRKTEDGRQETEDRRQETEDGGQKTGDGRQETEDGGQKTGDGRQETEDGRQRTVTSPTSHVPKSHVPCQDRKEAES